MTDAADPVLLDRRGPALWVRLNRPVALNTLDGAALGGLTAALDTAEADPTVRAVVLAGDRRAFCAGADIAHVTALADRSPEALAGFLGALGRVSGRLERSPLPVLAAVEGVAVGGGLELVLACDLAVAAESARVGDGHAVFGQVPGGGATVRLARRVGVARARHLMLTGETVPARTLAHTDLFTAVVPDGAVADEVDRVVALLAQRSPHATAVTKRLAIDALDLPAGEGLARELAATLAHARTADWREGVAAFRERRRPAFGGPAQAFGPPAT